MADEVQSTRFALGAVEGLLDGVEAATFGGEQRTTRAGVPLWRVVVSIREPGEIRRRSVDVLVAAPEAPTFAPDTRVALVAPTITAWRSADGRAGFTVRADHIEEVADSAATSRLPTSPSRGQR